MAATTIIKVSPEIKEALRKRKRPGQTFEGVLIELLQTTSLQLSNNSKGK